MLTRALDQKAAILLPFRSRKLPQKRSKGILRISIHKIKTVKNCKAISRAFSVAHLVIKPQRAGLPHYRFDIPAIKIMAF